MYELLRALLFLLDAERAHALTLRMLRAAQRLGLLQQRPARRLAPPLRVMGLPFANRIGLAAGFDKSGHCIDALGALGFGFLEIGTVTPRPQPGNARPRIFRVPAARAVINQMGFPNEGAAAACARLAVRRYGGICGVNIGKNADTPLELAARDYTQALRIVYPYADYVAVNVSSPNTSGLRQLLTPALLDPLLRALLEVRAELASASGRQVPLLVKLSPDLAPAELAAAAEVIGARGIDGIIATNTTVQRPALAGIRGSDRPGGLSGRPLHALALESVRMLRSLLGARTPIIGVGGIDSLASAREMLEAGADLLQLYTGLVYEGPALVRLLSHL